MTTVAVAPPVAGRVVRGAGAVVHATGISPSIGEVVLVGDRGLLGEVIRLEQGTATIQVYEETAGLRIGDPVTPTGRPLVAWLGPGLLGTTLDGLERPLERLAAAGETRLVAGRAGAPSMWTPAPWTPRARTSTGRSASTWTAAGHSRRRAVPVTGWARETSSGR